MNNEQEEACLIGSVEDFIQEVKKIKMPKIYDNQRTSLLSGLQNILERSYKSDICTAYFNLRGWKNLAPKAIRHLQVLKKK